MKTCRACGGNWFRLGDYYEFLREETVGNIWKPWPRMVGQYSPTALTVGICLCGTPWTPQIGGLRGGYDGRLLIENFLESLQRANRVNDPEMVVQAGPARFASQDDFEGLRTQLKALERSIGKRLRPGPGRPWALPKRKPASAGRDQFVLALEELGYTARQAKKMVKAVWDTIIGGVIRDGLVETPIGVFQVVRRAPQTHSRLGRSQEIYKRPSILFRPTRHLIEPIPREEPVTNVTITKNRQLCEICGSVEFIEGEFRQYADLTSSVPGGDISPITPDPIRALVCMCGNVIQPGRLRRLSVSAARHASFMQSVRAAKQRRESMRAQNIFQRLAAGNFATKEEAHKLAQEIEQLTTILRELPSRQ